PIYRAPHQSYDIATLLQDCGSAAAMTGVSGTKKCAVRPD
ncbi:MAG: hypothetical protein ACI8XW_002222, partial [Gammaproteobacteria bacterium]